MAERKTAEHNAADRKSAAAKQKGKRAAARTAAVSKTGKRVRVTLVRSVIGTRQSHRATVRGLGLRRRHQTVELEDTPAVRGMINKVDYLLRVEA